MAFRAKPPDGKPPYLCFMKDYWRAISDDIRSELEIYRKLKGVPFVATALGGGDVVGQVTRTDEYLKIDKLLKRQHCIVVIEQLGRPLEDYKTSSHMIVVVYDALRGAREVIAVWLPAAHPWFTQDIKQRSRQAFSTVMLASTIS